MPEEVHVGDVGTKYRCRCYDNGADFDPSAATVKKIRFKMPGLQTNTSPPTSVAVIEKDASVETGSGSEAGQFFLYYVITAADVDSLGFHSRPGPIKIQGYVEFSASQLWYSDIIDEDTASAELRVYKNLS